MPQKALKVLSLDGGGIRGVSSLYLLRSIFNGIRYRMDPPQPNLQPHEYFDLIGGTSTGGLVFIPELLGLIGLESLL
jgi:patatin-like phospholipase/acyl hydrolase